MKDLLKRAFDFGVSVVEMVKWLEDNNKNFPLKYRLLECGTDIFVLLRMAKIMPKGAQAGCVQIVHHAEEFHYLMEIMVKTGDLTETQSKPLLSDCSFIRDETVRLMSGKGTKKLQNPQS